MVPAVMTDPASGLGHQPTQSLQTSDLPLKIGRPERKLLETICELLHVTQSLTLGEVALNKAENKLSKTQRLLKPAAGSNDVQSLSKAERDEQLRAANKTITDSKRKTAQWRSSQKRALMAFCAELTGFVARNDPLEQEVQSLKKEWESFKLADVSSAGKSLQSTNGVGTILPKLEPRAGNDSRVPSKGASRADEKGVNIQLARAKRPTNIISGSAPEVERGHVARPWLKPIITKGIGGSPERMLNIPSPPEIKKNATTENGHTPLHSPTARNEVETQYHNAHQKLWGWICWHGHRMLELESSQESVHSLRRRVADLETAAHETRIEAHGRLSQTSGPRALARTGQDRHMEYPSRHSPLARLESTESITNRTRNKVDETSKWLSKVNEKLELLCRQFEQCDTAVNARLSSHERDAQSMRVMLDELSSYSRKTSKDREAMNAELITVHCAMRKQDESLRDLRSRQTPSTSSSDSHLPSSPVLSDIKGTAIKQIAIDLKNLEARHLAHVRNVNEAAERMHDILSENVSNRCDQPTVHETVHAALIEERRLVDNKLRDMTYEFKELNSETQGCFLRASDAIDTLQRKAVKFDSQLFILENQASPRLVGRSAGNQTRLFAHRSHRSGSVRTIRGVQEVASPVKPTDADTDVEATPTLNADERGLYQNGLTIARLEESKESTDQDSEDAVSEPCTIPLSASPTRSSSSQRVKRTLEVDEEDEMRREFNIHRSLIDNKDRDQACCKQSRVQTNG